MDMDMILDAIEDCIESWNEEQTTHFVNCFFEHPKCMAALLLEHSKESTRQLVAREALLQEAIDEFEDVLAYVDDYFVDKWGYREFVQKLKDALKET